MLKGFLRFEEPGSSAFLVFLWLNQSFFLYLGGTSSILRTFWAEPVKKTPCILTKSLFILTNYPWDNKIDLTNRLSELILNMLVPLRNKNTLVVLVGRATRQIVAFVSSRFFSLHCPARVHLLYEPQCHRWSGWYSFIECENVTQNSVFSHCRKVIKVFLSNFRCMQCTKVWQCGRCWRKVGGKKPTINQSSKQKKTLNMYTLDVGHALHGCGHTEWLSAMLW